MILPWVLLSVLPWALFATSMASYGNTQPTPSPIPASVRAICLAQVGRVVKMPTGTAYVVTFDSLDNREGSLSGVVSLYGADERYDVMFPATVAGAARDADRRNPIVVRFTAP